MTSFEIALTVALVSAIITIVFLLGRQKIAQKQGNSQLPNQQDDLIKNSRFYTPETLTLKLKLALDTSDASVWSFSIEKQTFSPLYGQVIAPDGTTFNQCYDMLHPESRDIYLKIFDNLTSGTTSRESTIYHFIDPIDGSDKYYASEMASIKTTDGTITEIIGTQREITQEYYIKQELTQQLNLLNAIFNNMPAGMAYIDKNGFIIKHNQVGTEMFGPEESYKQPVNVFNNPNLPESVRNILREGLSTHTLITYSKDANQKNKKYIDFRVTEVKTSDGKTNGYLCICSDITELIESTRKTEELSHRYEALFRSITSGVEIRDNNWNIIDSNEANFELFGVLDRAEYLSPKRQITNSPILDEKTKEKLRNYQPFTSYVDVDFDKVNAIGDFKSGKKGKIILEVKFTPLSDKNGDIIGSVILSSDVTANTLLNKKYEDLYRQQSTILAMLPIGVHIYNSHGLLIYQNHMSKKLFGANLTYQINVFDNPNIPNDVKEKLRQGKDHSMDLEYDFEKIKQSNYFRTELTGIKYINGLSTAVRDENGEIQYYAHTFQDTTESIKAKREINDINNKLSMAVGNSSILPWDYDCAKQEFTPYHDHDTQPNIFKRSLEYVHPDDIKEAERIHSIMLERRNESFKADIRYKLTETTGWQCGTVFGQPYEYDKNGNVTKYTGFRKDVTRWKTMTDQLESLIRQNKLMLNNTQSALIYFNADYSIQWENVSQVFSNFPKAEKYKTGLTCYKDIKGYDTPCKGCALTTAVNTKSVSTIQLDIDGMFAEMIATPILDADGKLEGVVMRIDDITERKRISDELKAAKEKAEQSNQLKSAFLANMSHEIRTPLNAIVGFASIMANAETEEDKAEYTKIISTNSDLLLNLINDILDLSKIESGYLEMHPDTIDFAEIFHELHLSFAMRMKENVELKCVSPYSSCITSALDKQRILQIMTNFTSNAIKFTRAGSITIGYEYSDNGIMIYVSDTGIGISSENRKKVFQRFQKFDTFTQGTGLGLSICKAITEAMGGKIGFKSEEGKGSTFWAWLPCKAKIKNLD